MVRTYQQVIIQVELVWKLDKRRPAFWLYMFVSATYAMNGVHMILLLRQNRYFAFLYYVWDTSELVRLVIVWWI